MTLFKEPLALAIAQGRKTQTRRLATDADCVVYMADAGYTKASYQTSEIEHFTINREQFSDIYECKAMLYRNGRLKFATGRDYAVQTKRGGKGRLYFDGKLLDTDTMDQAGIWKPLRFIVTHIGAEDVRSIALDDAKAEGFVNCLDFLYTWMELNDPVMKKIIKLTTNTLERREQTVDVVYNKMMSRPDEFYRAWIIEFKVCN